MNNLFNQAINQYNYGLAQQQALQNIQGGIWGGLGYGTSARTGTSGYTDTINYPTTLTYIKPEQPKKKQRIIVELREEMRNWHGELV